MRIILAIELLVLVGPALLIWIVGLVLVPMQFYALLFTDEPADGPLLVLASVIAGTCGLISVADLYRKAVNPDVRTLTTRWLSALGIIGSLPLVYFAFHSTSPVGLVYLMPLVACAHLAYLARHALFSTGSEW